MTKLRIGFRNSANAPKTRRVLRLSSYPASMFRFVYDKLLAIQNYVAKRFWQTFVCKSLMIVAGIETCGWIVWCVKWRVLFRLITEFYWTVYFYPPVYVLMSHYLLEHRASFSVRWTWVKIKSPLQRLLPFPYDIRLNENPLGSGLYRQSIRYIAHWMQ